MLKIPVVPLLYMMKSGWLKGTWKIFMINVDKGSREKSFFLVAGPLRGGGLRTL